MKWWRWNTCTVALKVEKYQPLAKEGGKKEKKFKFEKYRPKEDDIKKSKKKKKKTLPTDRPMFWHPKGNTTSFYFRPYRCWRGVAIHVKHGGRGPGAGGGGWDTKALPNFWSCGRIKVFSLKFLGLPFLADERDGAWPLGPTHRRRKWGGGAEGQLPPPPKKKKKKKKKNASPPPL